MGISIKPNEPLKCMYLGVPAHYRHIYEGGYEIRLKICDIPLEGHELSSLRKQGIGAGYGEASLFADNLDDVFGITDVEEMVVHDLRACK